MKDKKKRNTLIVTALLVLSIILIATALFFSREQNRTYSFEVGKPWLHPRLEANFQFDIELDEATRKHIIDSVNQNFAKIYTLDRKKGEQQLALLYRASAGHVGAPALITAVKKLYDDGIVDNDAANDIRAGKQLRFLVGNNQLQVVDTRDMRTVAQAYAYLTDSLAGQSYLQEAIKAVDITKFLVPNMKVDEEENDKWLGEDLRNALRSPGTVQAGEAIITRGEIVTAKKASAIESYQNELARRNKQRNVDEMISLLGQILIVATMMLAFYYFMKRLRNQVFSNTRRMVFLITFITVFVIAVFLCVRFKYSLLYVIPFGLVPIIVSSFFDDHTSFFVHIVTVLICSLIASSHQAEFIIMQFLAGIIAIVSVKELTKRTQLVQCAAFIFLAYCVTYIAMTLIAEGDFHSLDKYYFAFFLINCVILSFAFLIIPIVEKAFGFIPAILLTSVFYSFHHAGFQPEFLHLFLVGLMYSAVFYITRNMLVIFPFFWGVGALWDVIISSEAGSEIKNVESFVFAMIIWLLIVIWLLYRRRRSKRNAVENIHSDHGDPDQGREKCV